MNLTRFSLAVLASVPVCAAQLEFEKDVLPILETHCAKCHSGDGAQASLDVRTRASLVAGGKSGPAIVSGEPEQSRLIFKVRSGQMPKDAPKLGDKEIETLRRWIELGAPAADPGAKPSSRKISERDRQHWAFQKPVRPATPRVQDAGRVRTPIDAFVLAKLEAKGLGFNPDADRAVLLRRLWFDLVGLPPSPEALDAFLADRSANAYEKAVDDLLANPRYGERWARHWLDTAGYTDSEGVLAADVVRNNSWRYRDYVIRAFNSDKPYDQFVQEQLAGDEISEYRKYDGLPRDVHEKLAATGFLRTAVDATREDFLPKDFAEYQWRTLFDTEQILASTFLGLTLQCARCHDHKYEPLTQRDYYSVQAVLAGAIRPTGPVLPSYKRIAVDAPKAEQDKAEKHNKPVQAQAKALRDLLNGRRDEYRNLHPKGEEATDKELREAFPEYARKSDETNAELKATEKKAIALPSIRMLSDIDGEPPPTYVLRRGDPLSPGDVAEPGVPEVLDDPASPFRAPAVEKGAATTGRRLAFARWLTQPDHPLTARVMVNRVWAGHFGTGIVATQENFGRSGAKPTHPELLDWLATEFVRQGWSLKKLHKTIVMSTVYRQSATPRAEGLTADPTDALLWRMPPRRLEGEIVRDAILAASGKLDEAMFGEPVKSKTKASGEIAPEEEAAGGRRSIYQLVRRSAPLSLLDAFDAPVMEINCVRRSTTTSATQALALMNGEFVTAQAEHFAKKMLDGREETAAARATRAFRTAFARAPTAQELDRLLTFLEKQESFYREKPGNERRLRAWADLCQALLGANEFVYLD